MKNSQYLAPYLANSASRQSQTTISLLEQAQEIATPLKPFAKQVKPLTLKHSTEMNTAKELLAQIESENSAYESAKAKLGLFAAMSKRRDPALAWATKMGVAVPSDAFLRANSDKALSEIAAMLPKVDRAS